MPSINDMLCTKTFDESLTKLEDRYYLWLPIKDDVDKLPNNRQQAESRLLLQRKLMKNNAEFLDFYTNTVQKLIDTDKLELVDADCDCTPGCTFYISLFVTKQAQKRLIYDGSARFNNVSLTSVLHKGSDNFQKLYNVLIRFRRFPIAVSCDIQEMFLQCGIQERDCDLLRILWFEDSDIDKEIVDY